MNSLTANNTIEDLQNKMVDADEQLELAETMLDGYLPFNMWVCSLYGLDAALMLGKIYEKYLYDKAHNKLMNTYRRSIKLPIAEVKRTTGLSETRQRTALKILSDNQIVGVDSWGFPMKREVYLKIAGIRALGRNIERAKVEYSNGYFKRLQEHNEIVKKLHDWRDKKYPRPVPEEKCDKPAETFAF